MCIQRKFTLAKISKFQKFNQKPQVNLDFYQKLKFMYPSQYHVGKLR